MSEKDIQADMGTDGVSDQIIQEHYRETSCIRSPKIYTFMYHYVRDFEESDGNITHGLSVPPWLFEEHMKTIQNLAWMWLEMNFSMLFIQTASLTLTFGFLAQMMAGLIPLLILLLQLFVTKFHFFLELLQGKLMLHDS
jgi:hypothetical protein